VNLYGVVVDASLPFHNKDSNRYICTMKIIDQTLHTTGCSENLQQYKHLNCVFHAKRIEDCPQIKQVGDVIRVHRAQVKDFAGKKQLHVNVYFNSTWVLFNYYSKEAREFQQECANSDEEGSS
jgi:hypothetical protein